VVAVAAVAALVVTLVPGMHALRAPFAALLLLVLPGYSLAEALFGRRTIDWPRRLLLTVGLSISSSVVVGLLLNLAPFGLRAWSWSVALFVVTCAAGAVAIRDRGEAPSLPAGLRRLVALPSLLFVIGAALVLASAVFLAGTPLTAKNVPGYTAFWLVPGGREKPATVRVGIKSGELKALNFRLVVRVGKNLAYDRRLPAFQPGREFETTVAVKRAAAGGTPTVALLYREDNPGSVYRLARLWPPKS
jgi:uncharacterized membrane protein